MAPLQEGVGRILFRAGCWRVHHQSHRPVPVSSSGSSTCHKAAAGTCPGCLMAVALLQVLPQFLTAMAAAPAALNSVMRSRGVESLTSASPTKMALAPLAA